MYGNGKINPNVDVFDFPNTRAEVYWIELIIEDDLLFIH